MLAGQEQVPQAALARLGFQLLHHRGPRPRVLGLGNLLGGNGFCRVDVFVHEGQQFPAQLLGACVEREVHRCFTPQLLSASSPLRTRPGTSAPIRSNPAPIVLPSMNR